MASLLAQLDLQPAELAALPVEVGERVVDCLLRWQSYAEALACLDVLPELPPEQSDQRAAALHGLRRTEEAIARLEGSPRATLPLRMQLARLYVAAGYTARAKALASALEGVGQRIGPGVYLLAEVLLAGGDASGAEALLVQQMKAAPGSRQPVLGLMQVQAQRGDLVTAAAYAMRVLDQAARGPELAVEEVLALRAVFTATGDTARARSLDHQLVERYDRDVAAMQALLANARQLRPAVAPQQLARPASTPGAPPASATAGALPPQLATPVSTPAALSSVAVPAKERHELAVKAKQFFGYKQLLPGQAEVLACVQRGEHVLAVMPTGAGKSLCYQLPAFTGAGTTLVVSPLVALMKDQLDGLPDALRDQAVAVHGALEGDSVRRVVERIGQGQYKLVYAAPERLRQQPFLQAMRAAGVSRLVVDEAHCVSLWGHDFRPDYLHIVRAHRDLGSPPLLAMTATAPPRVRHDIERQLLGGAGAMRVLVGDVFRPNLHLTAAGVRDDEEQQQVLQQVLQQLPGPGIVYARSRQRCEELAAWLTSLGVRAAAYHAGLADRTGVQDRFMRNELSVIVATVAFGMGIDKRDIRLIVHCGLPNSLEGYYQEIGRAGRDGQDAHCVLVYNEGDQATLGRLAGRSRIDAATVWAVYGAVRDTLRGQPVGLVPLAALAPAAKGDETVARMVLGVLEQTGLVQRGYDAPQTLTVQRLPQHSGRRPDPALADFFRRANLDQNATAAGTLGDLAAATGIGLEGLEAALVAWEAAGWLRYYPANRAPLVALPPRTAGGPPAKSEQRIESLLAQRAAVTEQRIQEIADYARTRACRHGYLAEALGSGRRGRCGVCDNCGDGLHLAQPAAAAGVLDPAAVVLDVLAEQSYGRRTLIRLLRGDPEAGDRARSSAYFGAFPERSEQSLGQLLDSLLAERLIQTRALDHGGVTLEATGDRRKPAGRKPASRNSGGRNEAGRNDTGPKPRNGTAKWR